MPAPWDSRGSIVPDVHLWLSAETWQAQVRDIVQSVAEHHPAVQAIILFGSVARREPRPLDEAAPSDVDLLLMSTPPPCTPRRSA